MGKIGKGNTSKERIDKRNTAGYLLMVVLYISL